MRWDGVIATTSSGIRRIRGAKNKADTTNTKGTEATDRAEWQQNHNNGHQDSPSDGRDYNVAIQGVVGSGRCVASLNGATIGDDNKIIRTHNVSVLFKIHCGLRPGLNHNRRTDHPMSFESEQSGALQRCTTMHRVFIQIIPINKYIN